MRQKPRRRACVGPCTHHSHRKQLLDRRRKLTHFHVCSRIAPLHLPVNHPTKRRVGEINPKSIQQVMFELVQNGKSSKNGFNRHQKAKYTNSLSGPHPQSFPISKRLHLALCTALWRAERGAAGDVRISALAFWRAFGPVARFTLGQKWMAQSPGDRRE